MHTNRPLDRPNSTLQAIVEQTPDAIIFATAAA
jgi:hypothetical protein